MKGREILGSQEPGQGLSIHPSAPGQRFLDHPVDLGPAVFNMSLFSVRLCRPFLLLSYWAASRYREEKSTRFRLRVCYNAELRLLVAEPPVVTGNPVDQFQWLPKEHMCVLVYLVRLCFPPLLPTPNTGSRKEVSAT